MRGVPRERPAISCAAVGAQLDLEQPGAADEHLLELGRRVGLHVGGEAEPVAQRAGEQAAAGRRADERERRDLERDRRAAGALADDDVDPEVLHRDVEQLLRRPGDAVDLVDEQHLALGQAAHQRGEVAGALERRPAGDADAGPELGRDDHRQRRLAEPGRAGQQHVVRRPAAAAGALEHQPDLLAHPLLPDELVEPARAQRRLDDPLLVAGAGLHEPGSPRAASSASSRATSSSSLTAHRPELRPAPPAAAPARRSSVASGWLAARPSTTWSDCAARPAETDERLRQRVAPARRRATRRRRPARRAARPCP